MKTNPTVVILHGWSLDPGQAQKWQNFQDILTQRHISSHLLKIPGLSAPLNEVWNLDNYVKWLDEELRNQSDIILLGHSFGGQIAVRYAALYPQKISQLILIDSSGIRSRSLVATLKRSCFKVMAKIGKVFFQSEWARKILYKLARERDYQNAPPLLRRTMSQILDDEVVTDLSKINCPTLLIWGRDDKVTPLALARIFEAKISQSHLKVVGEARHSPQYTHPEVVADAVQKFLFQNESPL